VHKKIDEIRCVVCHEIFQTGEEYLFVRIWNKARVHDHSFFDTTIEEWDAIICGKCHLQEYIDKTV
jgi:hypothetical protein